MKIGVYMANSKKKSDTIFNKDEFGKEILLKNGNQVMMEWEKPYMEACIQALNPKGDVLEIGFGLGYSANAIQNHRPKSHTIIENDPVVLEQARSWAKQHPNVKIVEGSWQEQLDKLGQFDSIFFDDYSPLSKKEIDQIKHDASQGQELVEEAKSMHKAIEAALKQFRGVKFSDKDLKSFAQQALNRPGVTKDYVLRFVDNLEKWGNISAEQKSIFIQELDKKAKNSGKEEGFPWQQPKEFPGDRFVVFVEACLNRHMRKGARLSGYIGAPESLSKHSEFQKRVISRKDVNFQEKSIPVSVPPNCTYYRGDKALIIIIEKKQNV